MIIELFVKNSLLPALFLGLLCLSLSFLKGWKKDLTQGALFAGAFFVSFYQIQGGIGNYQKAGMEALVVLPLLLWLTLFFVQRSSQVFLFQLVMSFFLVSLLAWPLMHGFSSGFLHFHTTLSRTLIAFVLLTTCVWSYMGRQFRREGWWASHLTACLVSSGAAALFFLFKSSASLSQTFGFLATVSGVLLALSLFFGWRVSEKVAAVYLAALFVLLLMAGCLYMDIRPLRTLVLCVPFLIAVLRPFFPLSRGGVIKEVLVTGIPAVISVAWLVYQAYLQSGPLY
jgi:hypothetical protein